MTTVGAVGAADHLDELVSLERGEVDRRVFVDEEIFEREMEHLFGRAWLFLCHESQVPEPGDFFEGVMGRDNVLVVRQKDGSIRALINSCPHRGNAVCRAEEGNARSFLCTYHGWSFGLDGRLKGVPGFKEFYGPELVKSERGMAQVAQVDSYRGFIFGTHDASAPSLTDYLGPTGRLAIDLLACKGDIVAMPGVQKFVIDCNWKIAVDNLYDWYHPQVSHASAFQAGVVGPPRKGATFEGIDMSGVEMESGDGLAATLSTISASRFDQMVLLGEFGHGIGGPTFRSPVTPTCSPRCGSRRRRGRCHCASRAHRRAPRCGGSPSSTATPRPSSARPSLWLPAEFSARQGCLSRTTARTGCRRRCRATALQASA